MVVEDKSHAEEFEEDCNQENSVGGIAGLKDAEAGPRINAQREKEFRREGAAIFDDVTKRHPKPPRCTVPVNSIPSIISRLFSKPPPFGQITETR
jgi:hypothetical protein